MSDLPFCRSFDAVVTEADALTGFNFSFDTVKDKTVILSQDHGLELIDDHVWFSLGSHALLGANNKEPVAFTLLNGSSSVRLGVQDVQLPYAIDQTYGDTGYALSIRPGNGVTFYSAYDDVAELKYWYVVGEFEFTSIPS